MPGGAGTERTGVLHLLERSIISQAVRAAARIHAEDEACLVNINLTATQLVGSATVEHLRSECEAFSVRHDLIRIEVTESAVADRDSSAKAIGQLGALGFGIVLDDFGTGYSNFARLAEIPAVGLKIDGSFVRPLPESDRSRSVCEMLVNAGRTLQLPPVAEHVETTKQAQALLELGCVLHQGYLYASGLALDEALGVAAGDTSQWQWPARSQG